MDDADDHDLRTLRLIRLKEVLTLIPVSRSGFYAGIKTGRYPAPVIDGRMSMWLLSEVEDVINRLVEQRDSSLKPKETKNREPRN